MSKNKLSYLSYIAIGIGILSCSVFAFIYIQNASMENIVKDFWQYALDNKMNEAKKLTVSSSRLGAIRSKDGQSSVIIEARNMDGTEIDSVYREEIYERQIKIDKITEVEKSSYRAGVRLETTDKDDQKSEFIACLGQTSEDNSWKVFRVTLSNVNDKPETIKDKCFEKSH